MASNSFNCGSFFFLPKFPLFFLNQLLLLFLFARVTFARLFYIYLMTPISSHPHPLPQNPKDCSIHLCLFCCLTYRVIVTFFLNSTLCTSILYWYFSFWLTSLCTISSSFIHLIKTDSNVFFLMAE